MTLRMADGPVANLPAGFDAYGGYVNHSGIGVTFPQVVAKFPNAKHLSITTNGSAAMCADVEPGAMTKWTGYSYGYCSVADAQSLINKYGRPPKLWTAHYTGVPHICNPACGYGFTGYADGTQWTTHNNTYDESLLQDNFFSFSPPPPTPLGENMLATDPTSGGTWALAPDGGVDTDGGSPFLGGLAGNRFNWQAVGKLAGVAAYRDPQGSWGYKISVLLPSPNAQGAWFAYYAFPRNGQLR